MSKNEPLLKAKPFAVRHWVDKAGKKITPIELDDFKGKFKIVFCFQSWCPACHSIGLPSLKNMTEAIPNHPNLVFLAIQTVFEGYESNTYEKMLETQKNMN